MKVFWGAWKGRAEGGAVRDLGNVNDDDSSRETRARTIRTTRRKPMTLQEPQGPCFSAGLPRARARYLQLSRCGQNPYFSAFSFY